MKKADQHAARGLGEGRAGEVVALDQPARSLGGIDALLQIEQPGQQDIAGRLGWQASLGFEALIAMMIEVDMKRLKTGQMIL